MAKSFVKKLDSGGYEGDIKKSFKAHAKSKALESKGGVDFYGNPKKDMEERKSKWTHAEHIAKHTKRENAYNPSCNFCK